MSEWKPISTVPKDGSIEVLVYNPDFDAMYLVSWEEDEQAFYADGEKLFRESSFTHWMPLPNPPEVK